jgi:hypothetical protein
MHGLVFINSLKDFDVNISETEVPIRILAKTCRCDKKNEKRVTYQLIDSYHPNTGLLYAKLEACERLLKYAADTDKKIVESEIRELKMDLLT